MSEINEEKQTKENECVCKCFLKSEFLKKVLAIALGTFIGVYGSLSLFAATHKPPIKKFHRMEHVMPPMHHHPHMNNGPAGFHHDFKQPDFDKHFAPKPIPTKK